MNDRAPRPRRIDDAAGADLVLGDLASLRLRTAPGTTVLLAPTAEEAQAALEPMRPVVRWVDPRSKRVTPHRRLSRRARAADPRRALQTAVEGLDARDLTPVVLPNPLTGLGSDARARLRADLARLDASRLIGSASLADALLLGDRIAVLDQGQLAQIGTPEEITARPRTPLLGELLGINLLSGLARGGQLAIGHSKITAPTELDDRVLVVLPREAISITAAPEGEITLPSFEARVVSVREEPHGLAIGLSPVDPDIGLACTAAVPFTSPIDPAVVVLGARVSVLVDTSRMRAHPFEDSAG